MAKSPADAAAVDVQSVLAAPVEERKDLRMALRLLGVGLGCSGFSEDEDAAGQRVI